MLDLSFEKLLVIGLLALFLVGPERLPAAAAQLGRWVRTARTLLDGAKERMREELGPDFDEEDWQRLDPRRYDPRRIVREALLEEPRPVPDRSPRPAEAYEVVEDEPAGQEPGVVR